MALSDWDKAIYGYIVGKVAPKGMTRAAFKVAIGAAILTTQGLGRAIGPTAVRAAPFAARALMNPYVGVPLAATAGTLALQEGLEQSGIQEEVNVARDEAIATILDQGPKRSRAVKRKVKSTYNRAVSKAMKAVRASTKAGPKGTIKNAKKTFGQVSKAVSKAKKGVKLRTTGVEGVVKKSVSSMFKRIKQKAKKRLRKFTPRGLA